MLQKREACLCFVFWFIQVLLWLPVSAEAADYGLSLGVESEHSDNALLVEDDAVQAELSTSFKGALRFSKATERLGADIDYRGRWINFKNDTNRDQTLVEGRGHLEWNIIADNLSWALDNARLDIEKDSRFRDVLDNHEIRDTLSTGPVLKLSLTPVDKLMFRAAYSQVRHSDSLRSDTERDIYSSRWTHDLSPVSEFSFGGSYSEISNDRDDSTNRRSDVSVEYLQVLAHISLGLEVGANNYKTGERDENGTLARISVLYTDNGHGVRLSGLQVLTDTSIGFGVITELNLEEGEFDSEFEQTDIVERKRVGLNYAYSDLCARCSIKFDVYADERDYDLLERDTDSFGSALDFGYRFSNRLTMTNQIFREKKKFLFEEEREDREIQGKIQFKYHFRSEYNVTFWLRHRDRTSSVEDAEFREASAGFGFEYNYDHTVSSI